MKKYLLLSLFLFLPTTHATACDVFKELYDEHVVPDRVLFFGELHGNKQMPALFGDVACEILAKDHDLTVGLEIDVASQDSLDQFFAAQSLGAGLNILLTDEHWQGNDGRASEAKLQLLQRLYQLAHASDSVIQVYAFSEQSEDRSERMFRNIQDVMAANNGVRHIVLSGNLHSQTLTDDPTVSDEAMSSAYRLKSSGGDVKSYNLSYAGGETWLCMAECAAYELPFPYREGPYRQPIESRYAIFKHDFEINVGVLEVSPPVFAR